MTSSILDPLRKRISLNIQWHHLASGRAFCRSALGQEVESSRSARRSTGDRLPRGAPSHQSGPIVSVAASRAIEPSGSSPHISSHPIAAFLPPAAHTRRRGRARARARARESAPGHGTRDCHILLLLRAVSSAALCPFTRMRACVRASCASREMPTESELRPVGPYRVGRASKSWGATNERKGEHDGKGGNDGDERSARAAARRPAEAEVGL